MNNKQRGFAAVLSLPLLAHAQEITGVASTLNDGPPLIPDGFWQVLLAVCCSLLLSGSWLKLNHYIRRERSWGPVDRLTWFLIGVSQLGMGLGLFAFSTGMMMEQERWPFIVFPVLAGAIAWGVHFYGLRVWRGKLSWVATVSCSLLMLLFFACGDPMTTWILFIPMWLVIAFIRLVQSGGRPAWLSSPEATHVG